MATTGPAFDPKSERGIDWPALREVTAEMLYSHLIATNAAETTAIPAAEATAMPAAEATAIPAAEATAIPAADEIAEYAI